MVIHRSGDEPGEGHHQVVLGRAAVTPLEVFQIESTLVVHEVGIGALPAGRFPDAMEVN